MRGPGVDGPMVHQLSRQWHSWAPSPDGISAEGIRREASKMRPPLATSGAPRRRREIEAASASAPMCLAGGTQVIEDKDLEDNGGPLPSHVSYLSQTILYVASLIISK